LYPHDIAELLLQTEIEKLIPPEMVCELACCDVKKHAASKSDAKCVTVLFIDLIFLLGFKGWKIRAERKEGTMVFLSPYRYG